jgi:hypothetical protein
MFFSPDMNFSINAKFTRFLLGSIATLSLSISGHNPAFSLSTQELEPIVNPVKSTLIAKEISIDNLSDSKIIEYNFPQVKVATIELLPGLGTNISFDSVNQTIQTIFLDNQSHISMNTNGCLASEGRCSENSQIPTLIHLSLIDDIELPGVIRVNKQAAHNSLLTVVTVDAQRKRQTYLFALKLFNKNSGRKHVALVRIVPSAPKLAVKPVLPSEPAIVPKRPEDVSKEAFMNSGSTPFIPPNLRVTDRKNIGYLTEGFRLAVNRGDYKFNFIEYRNLNGFIKAVNGSGATLDSAPFYGLRLDVIDNLVTLGIPTAPRDLPPIPVTEASPAPVVPPTTTQKPTTNEQEVSRTD